jgi:hypothetical protein
MATMAVILATDMFEVPLTLSRASRENVIVARRNFNSIGDESIMQSASLSPAKALSVCVSSDFSWPARPDRIHT